MLAGKCDRCGKYYQLNGKITIEVERNRKDMSDGHRYYGDKYELCPDCTDSFDNWVKMKEEGEETE